MGILRPPKVQTGDLDPSCFEIGIKAERPVNKPTISLPAGIVETIKASRALVSRSKLLRTESERRIDATIHTIESCCRDKKNIAAI